MLLKDIIYKGIETVSVLYPEGEAREMVFAYLEDVFGIRRHTHVLEPDRSLSDTDSAKALSDFQRMASGEPLQYVTGKAYFYGREFRVSPSVLIPRPETELLCRQMCEGIPSLSGGREPLGKCTGGFLQQAADGEKEGDFGTACHKTGTSVLDLCTGSGCIAWTLALECPGTQVTAVDISEEALWVAQSQDFSEELSRTGAMMPIFVKADVLRRPDDCPEICATDKKFDMIVSNPPYVMDSEKALMRSNVLDHEPHLALFVPDNDPLVFYRAVALWAKALLKENGEGMVEINEALGQETAEIYIAEDFGYTEIVRDLHGKDRFVRFSKLPLRKKNRFF